MFNRFEKGKILLNLHTCYGLMDNFGVISHFKMDGELSGATLR
jgi:hypothetical protein